MLNKNPAGKLLCFAHFDEAERVLSALGFSKLYATKHTATSFESHRNFDFISLGVVEPDSTDTPQIVEIYFMQDRLLFFHDHVVEVEAVIREARENAGQEFELESFLYSIFSRLTENDSDALRGIEEEIANLEDDISEDADLQYSATISQLRKRLLQLKRYYESLVSVLENLEENRNKLLSEKWLHYFHFQRGRTNRLYLSVLNLRDYVTQVRESYQAQMDIRLNKTMKLFTVVTTIFLPLSLIAGWYGMNLDMPEYGMAHSYTVVIIVSISVVLVCVLYFRKNKWF